MPSDTKPPKLVSLDLVDSSIDIGSGENSIDLTAHLTDDLSGLAPPPYLAAEIRFVSPSGQFVDGTSYGGPVSGNFRDGIYKLPINLSAFAEEGTWKVEHVYLVDEAGNQKFLDRSNTPDLATKSFHVVNPNSDITPPKLQSINLSDHVIDIGGGEDSFIVTARLTDDVSGLAPPPYLSAEIRFVSPNGQFVDGVSYGEPFSGSRLDGFYKMPVSLGGFAEVGTWKVEYLHLVDQAGNNVTLNRNDSSLLDDNTFAVTNSASDTTPPELEYINIETRPLNPNGTSTFDITTHLTDDLSGVASAPKLSVEVRFVSSTGQFADGTSYGEPVSGDVLDGFYGMTVNLSAFAEAGTWKVEFVHIVDEAGNLAVLNPENTPKLLSTVILVGSASGDAMDGTPSTDAIFSFSGDDALRGLAGDDRLDAGDGNDSVDGGGGDDEIVGGSGAGDDRYTGGAGDDTVVYTSAKKEITVDLAKGKASGAEIGHDKLKTVEGVLGGQAGDKIKGDKGENVLDGFTGKDKLTGGPGEDAFVFSTELGKNNVDKIKDFRPKDDIFHLDDAVFSGLALGKLAASAFHVGSHAKDGGDRVIYDDDRGVLLFDANGNEKGGEIVFARVDKGLDITHGDFLIV